MTRCYVAAVAAVTMLVACSDQRIDPPPFDGERALGYLARQVELGPRVPATAASARCRELLLSHFSSLGAHVDSQAFSFFDPYSRTELPLVNVVARFSGLRRGARAIVLVAHYDSRPRAEFAYDPQLRNTPIDGANDGASGVAVLMELGNLFAGQAPPCDVDLVLVDGEDWGMPGDHEYYMLGSREFSRRGIRDTYRFGIVIDLVGDSSQQIYREAYSEQSAPSLNDAVWSTARRLGVTTFRDSVRSPIMDDHLSLISAGVPAINIIDLDYPYWHTEFDTPDKCSAESLANVGRVVAEFIYNPSLWPNER